MHYVHNRLPLIVVVVVNIFVIPFGLTAPAQPLGDHIHDNPLFGRRATNQIFYFPYFQPPPNASEKGVLRSRSFIGLLCASPANDIPEIVLMFVRVCHSYVWTSSGHR